MQDRRHPEQTRPMRPLIVTLAGFGFILGCVGALVFHFSPLPDVGWFAYAPLDRTEGFALGQFRPSWMPSVVIFPGGGLIAGGLVGLAMGKARWQLVRR